MYHAWSWFPWLWRDFERPSLASSFTVQLRKSLENFRKPFQGCRPYRYIVQIRLSAFVLSDNCEPLLQLKFWVQEQSSLQLVLIHNRLIVRLYLVGGARDNLLKSFCQSNGMFQETVGSFVEIMHKNSRSDFNLLFSDSGLIPEIMCCTSTFWLLVMINWNRGGREVCGSWQKDNAFMLSWFYCSCCFVNFALHFWPGFPKSILWILWTALQEATSLIISQ